MKKQHVFIVIAVCFGLFLTWGALSVPAAQAQLYTTVRTPPNPEWFIDPKSLQIDPRMPVSGKECCTHPKTGASETLTVYVENANGQPAANANVNAYTFTGIPAGGGITGADGYVNLSLQPGTYIIRVSSMYDHFYIVQSNVSAPGSVSITTNGASQVTLTAKSIYGAPLFSFVEISVTGDEDQTGIMGMSDSNGILIFYVTPGLYNVGLLNQSNR